MARMDGLDAASVGEASGARQPQAIIHQMTALSGKPDMRHFDRTFRTTNSSARSARATCLRQRQRRGEAVIAQSYTGWPIRHGDGLATEDDPLDPRTAAGSARRRGDPRARAVVPARRSTGSCCATAASTAPARRRTRGVPEMVRKRQFPIIGDGAGVWSWIHVDDAASATVAALERGEPGVYNVVDDEPAPVASGCRLAEASARSARCEFPRGSAAPRRRRRRAHDDGDAWRVERKGEVGARLAPALASWRDGFRDALGATPTLVASRVRPARRSGGVSEERETFESLRPLLFAIAYRMLATVSDAEDVLQEAYLRWRRAMDDGVVIASLKAWLSTVVTRLAIDHLRSARTRREEYVGLWLPEPLADAPESSARAADPHQRAELTDSLSMAFLLVLERLSPIERAAFLLHDVFGYTHDEIATIVETTPANARQIASRARRHVQAERPRFDPSPEERDRLAERFFAAVTMGDVDGLVQVLADDVVVHGDGGGRCRSGRRRSSARTRVARALRRAWESDRRGRTRGSTADDQRSARGALVLDPEGAVAVVWVLDVVDGRVSAIRSVINPEKLGHLGRVADVRALAASRGRG